MSKVLSEAMLNVPLHIAVFQGQGERERKLIEKMFMELLSDLRTANNIDACLDCGCKAIYEATLFRRVVLTLHNDRREIVNLGQVALDKE